MVESKKQSPTRRKRVKSALYLTLKKRKVLKIVKRTYLDFLDCHLDFLKIQLLQNIKIVDGGPFGDKEISKKSRTVPKKFKEVTL